MGGRKCSGERELFHWPVGISLSLVNPAFLTIPPKPQVIESRKKEAPYMLPEDVFVERPR